MTRLSNNLLLAGCLVSISAGADTLTQEIDHLIGFVESSSCAFIRNGREHDAHEAAAHINKKYQHYKNDIASAEDFIRLSATRSMLSGKYYTVRCPGADTIKTAEWLNTELSRWRAGLKLP